MSCCLILPLKPLDFMYFYNKILKPCLPFYHSKQHYFLLHTRHFESHRHRKMKVLLHYEDNDNSDLHKSLKITLPKSWKTGPVSQLLEQFVESYNPKFDSNQLQVTDCHISMRQKISETSDKTELVPIASDAVVIDAIPDRADVYICHGASFTMEEKKKEEEAKIAAYKAELANIKIPLMAVMAEHDHIASIAATKPLLDLVGSEDTNELVLKGGHVSLIAGPNAIKRMWPRVNEWLGARSV